MAKVDVGAEEYDSYADLDFADVFLGGDVLRAGPWALRNEDARGRGLASATRMMLQLPWPDAPPSLNEPPPVVQEVTAMLAADLLAKPRLFSDASGDSNVKLAKAGSAQVEFFRPVQNGPPMPKALWMMLVHAGLIGSAHGDGQYTGAMVSGINAGCRPLGGRSAWDYPIAATDND